MDKLSILTIFLICVLHIKILHTKIIPFSYTGTFATQARCAVTSYGYGYNYGVPSENRYWDDDEVATPNQSVGTGYTQGSAYVRHLPGKNIFEYNARPMSGGYRMTGYGRVVTDPKEKNSEYVTIREVWFYHGIPMKSKNAWDFVTRMFTESPNSWEPFFSKNENFIRYLSAGSS